MAYDERDIESYQFLFALSNDDKMRLVNALNQALSHLVNVDKIKLKTTQDFDKWLSDCLDNADFDLLWLLLDFDNQINEPYYDFEMPNFDTIAVIAEKYAHLDNVAECRFMIWLEILRLNKL